MASAEFARDPHTSYREWRSISPTQRLSGGQEVMLLGFDAVSRVLRGTDFSSSPNREFSPVLHGADPPRHTKVRRQIQELFEHRATTARRDEVRDRTQSRVSTLMKRRTFDAVADLALPLAHETACGWLGLKEREASRFMSGGVRSATWAGLQKAMRSDSALLEALEAGELGNSDAAELAAFLMVAGVDTVRDCILLCLLACFRDERIIPLASGPIAETVTELIRLEPPVHTVMRRATLTCEIDGVAIPEGATLWASLASANRDPSRFQKPDEFVPGRPGAALSFGAGIHASPGRRLGSLEVEEAIFALLPKLERVMSSAREPVIRFTGPDGAPALRQIPHWKLSFR